ncbi:MAG: type II secretion system F family protein [Kiritimatiellae bacterium]|nr:type II secretion system F family protein [Kiritimatiellia bacterium]
MPVFAYTAKSRDGKKTTGQIDAQDRKSALSAIQRKGLVPISVMQKSGGKSSSAKDDSKKDSSTKKKNKGSAFKLSRPNYMSPVETLHFTSEICDLLESGMTLGNALNCLAAREGESEGVTDIVTGLRDAIIEGYTFSDALEKYPKVFSNIYTNMIRAGEASGAMTDVLHRLVDHFESQQAMRSKIKTAMFYPTIVLIMAVGVTIFAITYLLPKFKTIFDQLGPDG